MIRQAELEDLAKKLVLLQRLGNLQDKTQSLSEQISALRLTLETLNKTIGDKTQELQVSTSKNKLFLLDRILYTHTHLDKLIHIKPTSLML